jgi:hypothetical protein
MHRLEAAAFVAHFGNPIDKLGGIAICMLG